MGNFNRGRGNGPPNAGSFTRGGGDPRNGKGNPSGKGNKPGCGSVFRHFSFGGAFRVARNSTRPRSSDFDRCLIRSSRIADLPFRRSLILLSNALPCSFSPLPTLRDLLRAFGLRPFPVQSPT